MIALLPPPHYGSSLAFLLREDFGPFFCRRLGSNCAYPRDSSDDFHELLFKSNRIHVFLVFDYHAALDSVFILFCK